MTVAKIFPQTSKPPLTERMGKLRFRKGDSSTNNLVNKAQGIGAQLVKLFAKEGQVNEEQARAYFRMRRRADQLGVKRQSLEDRDSEILLKELKELRARPGVNQIGDTPIEDFRLRNRIMTRIDNYLERNGYNISNRDLTSIIGIIREREIVPGFKFRDARNFVTNRLEAVELYRERKEIKEALETIRNKRRNIGTKIEEATGMNHLEQIQIQKSSCRQFGEGLTQWHMESKVRKDTSKVLTG